MIYKCMAIDDEPLALDIIEDYISKVEFLELEHRSTSASDAFNFIKKNKIDILFLDIQMPDLSGFELLESLAYKPNVIITSAYEKYALKSYQFDVLDYLLKPISFPRFLKAIEKVLSKTIEANNGVHIENTRKNIFVYTNAEITKIALDEILYVKGLSDFITIKTNTKNYIVRDNLKRIEELLKINDFLRVHKSFIVSINKIESIKANKIKIGNDFIPVGRVYKNNLINKIQNEMLGKFTEL